jgi:hypothetical protein
VLHERIAQEHARDEQVVNAKRPDQFDARRWPLAQAASSSDCSNPLGASTATFFPFRSIRLLLLSVRSNKLRPQTSFPGLQFKLMRELSGAGSRHGIHILQIRRSDGFADFAQRGLQAFLERRMIEWELQQGVRGFGALDCPRKQMGDVVHARPEQTCALDDAPVPICINADKPGVPRLDLGPTLVAGGAETSSVIAAFSRSVCRVLRRRSPAEPPAWRKSFGCLAIALAAAPRSD